MTEKYGGAKHYIKWSFVWRSGGMRFFFHRGIITKKRITDRIKMSDSNSCNERLNIFKKIKMKKECSEDDIDSFSNRDLYIFDKSENCVVTRLDPSRNIFRKVTVLLM